MLKTLFALKGASCRLLLEAAWSLALAKVMLRCLPFPKLEGHFSRSSKRPELFGPERELHCREVRSAVERMAGFLPRSMVCFPRAIAVQAMLRRRGVSTTIVYGAQGSGDLMAHVWVQDGEQGVIGMPSDGEFTILARYSSLLHQ